MCVSVSRFLNCLLVPHVQGSRFFNLLSKNGVAVAVDGFSCSNLEAASHSFSQIDAIEKLLKI
jgi:hypothetical protein